MNFRAVNRQRVPARNFSQIHRMQDFAGRWPLPLLQCRHRMADWKQITARIRRARTSKDPAAQLTNLYEKTQDAMVAFELARHFETAGLAADSGKWYVSAAERFRRADWKTKALESAVRLGCEIPAGSLEAARAEEAASPVSRAVTPLAERKIPATIRTRKSDAAALRHSRDSPCRSRAYPLRKTPKSSSPLSP